MLLDDQSAAARAEHDVASFRSMPADERGAVWAAVLRDESGEGFAEYNAALSIFAVQCVIGALVMSRQLDHIIQAIRAIF
ncbi:MAG TPA: hypothetical protein VGT98_15305 [Candidatus Elarobacter sp.]|nr:hypothetical protein [Candidatus Elarobacter sp.]